MPGRGLFLAFEGTEGSGKTTQVALLADDLRSLGREVVVAREPGSTALGERVRELVLDDLPGGIPARSELFLMLAARAAFVEQVVCPARDAGAVVLADRFELSTLAYQGAGRALPIPDLRAINRFATGGVTPDATILLCLAPEQGALRQRRAGKDPDRMEREDPDFHRRVAEAYRALAGEVEGIVQVSGEGTSDQVRARIRAALRARFPETFPDAGVF